MPWTPTRTTTNWPPIILGLPSLFLEMSVCQLNYHGISILICPNMLCAILADFACVRILWKLRQQRGLKMVLAYVTNVLGGDEHVQNEVHALLFRQDHRVCELRKHFSFLFTLFLLFTPLFEDFSAAQPFLLQQVNNQLAHDFLSQQNNRLFLFLSELMDLFVAGQDQSAADQPNNLAEGHPPL